MWILCFVFSHFTFSLSYFRFWSRINCKKHHLCLLRYLSTWKDNIGNFLKFAIIHTDSFPMFYEYLPLVAVVAGFIILVRKVFCCVSMTNCFGYSKGKIHSSWTGQRSDPSPVIEYSVVWTRSWVFTRHIRRLGSKHFCREFTLFIRKKVGFVKR